MGANYPILNFIQLQKNMAVAVKNLQDMLGISVEVWRVRNRSEEKHVIAYGPSKVNLKSSSNSEKILDINILSTPQELYTASMVGSGNSELEVYTYTEELLVGDIIKYRWTENQVLEFTIIDLPKTYGEGCYQYRIRSTGQVKQ